MKGIYEKYRKAIIKVVLLIGILLAIFVVITYMIPFFAPFVLAIIISMLNEPVIKLLERLKIPRKIASIVSLLLTISILGVIITIGIIKIYNELVVLQGNISDYITNISVQLSSYLSKITNYYNNLPKEISGAIMENIKSLAPKLQGIITNLVGYLINTLSSIPKITVFLIVTLISTYFISSDRKKIFHFIYKQIPGDRVKVLTDMKSDTFTALFGYFKALLILMGLTFAEVTTGLSILRVDYALIMGLVVAISDAIPVVGTGVVMIPWILWNLMVGDMRLVFGLSIIYILGVIVRQILEPKIIGNQIGLHPLVTLIAMYTGLEIYGVLGMIIGPISIIIIKNLQNSGIISKIWNE